MSSYHILYRGPDQTSEVSWLGQRTKKRIKKKKKGSALLTPHIPTNQHFDDPRLAAKRLVARLRPGRGVLMIIDFFAHGKLDAHHPAQHTVKHHGFAEEEMRDIFAQAGAGGGFAVDDMGSITLTRPKEGTHETSELKRRLFIARGTKV